MTSTLTAAYVSDAVRLAIVRHTSFLHAPEAFVTALYDRELQLIVLRERVLQVTKHVTK